MSDLAKAGCRMLCRFFKVQARGFITSAKISSDRSRAA
jgi:hypothetical protein